MSVRNKRHKSKKSYQPAPAGDMLNEDQRSKVEHMTRQFKKWLDGDGENVEVYSYFIISEDGEEFKVDDPSAEGFLELVEILRAYYDDLGEATRFGYVRSKNKGGTYREVSQDGTVEEVADMLLLFAEICW